MKKRLFYLSILIISWIYSVLFNGVDWDFWARLSVGKIFLQTGQVMKNDIFSYAATKPMWIDHEWGSGVIFYLIANHFGDIGILVFKILAGFLIIFIISKIVEFRSTKPSEHLNLPFYYFAFIGMFYGTNGTVRCQLFTFIFFALWIYILERVRQGENRLLWLLPATALVWANLHGGFVSGLGLIGIYGIGELLNGKPFKKYFLILIPAVLITLINPYGIHYWYYIIDAATMPRITISEWLPTGIFPLIKWKGFKIFACIAITSLIAGLVRIRFRYKDMDKVKYILLPLTFYLAMAHNKHQVLFAMSAAIFLYHDFYAIFSSIGNYLVQKFGESCRKILNRTAIAKDVLVYTSVLLIGVLLIQGNPLVIKVNPFRYPVGSIEFLRINKIHGNILTLFHWGSYTAWKLYPNNFIAEDGRYEELYPESLHLKVYNFNYKVNEHWLDFLNEYHTDIIVLEKVNKSFPAMLKNKDWKLIYGDLVSAVFVPANKVRKSYIEPKITTRLTIYDKYKTDLDFGKK